MPGRLWQPPPGRFVKFFEGDWVENAVWTYNWSCSLDKGHRSYHIAYRGNNPEYGPTAIWGRHIIEEAELP